MRVGQCAIIIVIHVKARKEIVYNGKRPAFEKYPKVKFMGIDKRKRQ